MAAADPWDFPETVVAGLAAVHVTMQDGGRRDPLARWHLSLAPGATANLSVRYRARADSVCRRYGPATLSAQWQFTLPFRLHGLWRGTGPVSVELHVSHRYQPVTSPSPDDCNWGRGEEPVRLAWKPATAPRDLAVSLPVASPTLSGLECEPDLVARLRPLAASTNPTVHAVVLGAIASAALHAEDEARGGYQYGRHEAWQAYHRLRAAFPGAPIARWLARVARDRRRDARSAKSVAEWIEAQSQAPHLTRRTGFCRSEFAVLSGPYSLTGEALVARLSSRFLSFGKTTPHREEALGLAYAVRRRWPGYSDPLHRLLGGFYLFPADRRDSIVRIRDAGLSDSVHAGLALRLLAWFRVPEETIAPVREMAEADPPVRPGAETLLGRQLVVSETSQDLEELLAAYEQLDIYGVPAREQAFVRLVESVPRSRDPQALADAFPHLARKENAAAVDALRRALALAKAANQRAELPSLGDISMLYWQKRFLGVLPELIEQYPEYAGALAEGLAQRIGTCHEDAADRELVRRVAVRVYREHREPAEVRRAAHALSGLGEAAVLGEIDCRTDLPWSCSAPLLRLIKGPEAGDAGYRFLAAAAELSDVEPRLYLEACERLADPRLATVLKRWIERNAGTLGLEAWRAGNTIGKLLSLDEP